MRIGVASIVLVFQLFHTHLFSQPNQGAGGSSPTIPPEWEVPTTSHCWHRNDGQLLDTDGGPATSVSFYSDQSYPHAYITSEQIALVWSKIDTQANVLDTLARVDMMLASSALGVDVLAQEQLPGVNHYYLGHCPNGIRDVPDFSRLIYKGVYSETDLHLYSNNQGLKLYFVMSPDADPTLPGFYFSGAEEVFITPSGGLMVRSILGQVEFRKPLVYGLDSQGNRVDFPNSGRFWEPYPGEFRFEIEDGLAGQQLFIQVDRGEAITTGPTSTTPAWSTFYGGNTTENCTDIVVDDNQDLFVYGETFAGVFPVVNQIFLYSNGNQEVFVGKFDANYQRNYMVLYGGSGNEQASKISANANGQILITGTTMRATVPLPVNIQPGFFQESYPLGTTSGFVAVFAKQNAAILFATPFGGRNSVVTAAESDDNGNIYITGATFEPQTQTTCLPTGSAFPICGTGTAFLQTQNPSNNSCGFVAKFNPQKELVWSTLFGANGNDALYDLGIDSYYNFVYVVGGTHSTRLGSPGCTNPATSMPLCPPAGSGYFNPDYNGTNSVSGGNPNQGDGIIARFTLDGELNWSTFFGGPSFDVISGIAMRNAYPSASPTNYSGTFYITGSTGSNTYGTNLAQGYAGGFPQYSTGNNYSQPYGGGARDAYIAEFNVNCELVWSTYLGGSGDDGLKHSSLVFSTRCAIGGQNVYVAAATNSLNFPTLLNPNFYEQATHADAISGNGARDGYIIGFNSNRQMTLGTYYGGLGDDFIQGISALQDRLYVGGLAYSSGNFPLFNPVSLPGTAYFRGYPLLGSWDSHFGQLQTGNLVAMDEPLAQSAIPWKIFPNPTQGEVNLQYNGEPLGHSEVYVQLWDLTGKVIWSETHSVSSIESLPLHLPSVPKGMYLIEIAHGDSQYFAKLIVQ